MFLAPLYRAMFFLSGVCLGKEGTRSPAIRKRRRFRPYLEVLEARELLAGLTYTFKEVNQEGDSNGNWSNGNNWVITNAAKQTLDPEKDGVSPTPGANDTVVFNNPVTSTVDSNWSKIKGKQIGTLNIKSGANVKLDVQAPLDVTSGADITGGIIYSTKGQTIEFGNNNNTESANFSIVGGQIGASNKGQTTLQLDQMTVLTFSKPATAPGPAVGVALSNATVNMQGEGQKAASFKVVDTVLGVGDTTEINNVNGYLYLGNASIVAAIGSTPGVSKINLSGSAALYSIGSSLINLSVNNNSTRGGIAVGFGTLELQGGGTNSGPVRVS